MTTESNSTPPKIPPKLTIKPAEPATGSDSTGKPADPDAPTLILKKPVIEGSKKKTSRINLDAALTSRISDALEGNAADGTPVSEQAPTPAESAVDDDQGGPKTIRLQRPGAAPSITVVKPAATSQQAAKSQTSRIPLEKVLKSGSSSGVTGVKTIRLKKPGEEKTARASTTEPASAEYQAAKSRTARLDIPAEDTSGGDSAPPTQRKTIRIKRADGTTSGAPARTLSLARTKTDGDAQPRTADDPSPVTPRPPSQRDPGLVFTLATLAAVAVAGVLVYVMATQAFPDAGLVWPGQVQF